MNHPGSSFFYNGPPVGSFRRDCSGITSAMLGLRAPGETTRTLNAKTYNIEFSEMRPGDILNKAGSHVIIFAGWANRPGGSFWAYEEKGSMGVIISRKAASYRMGYLSRRFTSSCWHGEESAEGGGGDGDASASDTDPDDQDNGVPGNPSAKSNGPGSPEARGVDADNSDLPPAVRETSGGTNSQQASSSASSRASDSGINWWSDPPPWWSANPPEWGSPHGSNLHLHCDITCSMCLAVEATTKYLPTN